MENLADIIDALKKSKCFFSFDSFLIWKMGFLLTDNIYVAILHAENIYSSLCYIFIVI